MCSNCSGDYENPDATGVTLCLDCDHDIELHDSLGCQVVSSTFRCKCVRTIEELREFRPQVFTTGGPYEMRFTAYDPNRFDVCGDPDCSCRTAKANIRGYGASSQQALADFWQQVRDYD